VISGRHGVNSITIGDVELLLTSCGGGPAVHLASLAQDGPHRPAVPDYYFEGRRRDRIAALGNYDEDALRAPRWSSTTLCGREWSVMMGGDGGSISPYDEEPALAPTCRRCLAVMDRLFPPPPTHPQLALVAKIVTDTVVEHGHAELHGVPGDQQSELRRRIRSMVRAATGHTCQTLVHDSTLFVVCEPVYELHADAQDAAVAAALDDAFNGKTPVRADQTWRLSWSTWASS
jgi:hypothetical protein